MKTAILAILLFCIMIFPHELGHFIAAKLCKVQVNEFAFGMGPVIWKKQRGETLHTIRLFPIGGFCAMEGEDSDDEMEAKSLKEKVECGDIEKDKDEEGKEIPILVDHNPRAFYNKKPWEKLVVLAAGSFMNMICAFLILTIVVGFMGFTTTTIGEVYEDTPAYKAGMMEGDKIISIDIADKNGNVLSEKEVKTWNDVGSTIQASDGNDVIFHCKSKGQEVSYTVSPKVEHVLDANAEPYDSYSVGILCKKGHNPFYAIVSGFQSTVNMTKLMFSSLRMLFVGEVGVSDMSGPVGMVQMVSETISYGIWYYAFLVALICVNLAVINMLPLPALDGGRIIFVLWTWVTKKPVPAKVEGAIHAVGLILLLALMLYVTGFDIMRIFEK